MSRVPRYFENQSVRRRRFRSGYTLLDSGYTLLELILAMALSILVLVSIGMAINLYLVMLTQQQANIERQQVARNILAMVSSDLRSAIQYKAADVSGLENLSASQSLIQGLLGSAGGDAASAMSGLAGGGTPTGGGTSTGGGTPTGGGTSTGGGTPNGGGVPTGGGTPTGGGQAGGAAGGATESTETEDTAAYRPLIIGSQNQLTIDVSRLPRIDQYNAFMLGLTDPTSSRPSDVKSISYFLSSSAPVSATMEFDQQTVQQGGLYRRQIDRAVASYRGETSAPGVPDEYSKLLAPEIVGLEFRYFDGSAWANEWDSDEMQYFPTAIEVILTIDASRLQTRNGGRNQPADIRQQLSGIQQFRTVVHLPAAEVPAEEDE
jgi:hypothetical protein